MNLESTNNNKILINSTGKRTRSDTIDKMSKFACSFEELPMDSLEHIFSYLRLGPLTNLCLTSKSWENLTNFAPVWKMLCVESGILALEDQSRYSFTTAVRECNNLALIALSSLFIDNIHIKPDYDLAIQNLKSILIPLALFFGDISEEQIKFNENILGRLDFVEALKTIEKINTTDDINTTFTKYNISVRLFLNVSKNTNVPPKLMLESGYLAALICLRGQSNILSDVEAGTKLQSIFQNSENHEKVKSSATYDFCFYIFEDKFNLMSKEEAGKLLKSLLDNLFVGHKSKFLFLKLNFLKILSSMTSDEMMILAKSFLDSKDTELRCSSIYIICTLALAKASNLVSDDCIVQLLKSVLDSPDVSDTLKNESKWLLALMCCEKRSNLIPDDDNAKWILEFFENNSNPIFRRKNCGIALAKMIIENRTNILSNDEAAELLLNIIQHDTLISSNKIITNAIHLVLKFVIDNLTNPSINGEVAVTLLSLKNSTNQLINGHAKYALAELTSRNKTTISNASAFNYAAEACNNKSLTEEVRNNAASLMEHFRDLI